MFRPPWILSQMNSRIKVTPYFNYYYYGVYNPSIECYNYLSKKNNKYYIPKSFKCLENQREYNVQTLVYKELYPVKQMVSLRYGLSMFSGIVVFLFCMSIVYERPII